MKRLIYTVVMLFFVVQPGFADDKSSAKDLLERNLDAAVAVLQKKDLDQPTKNKQVVDIVSPMFDFNLMAKLTLGRKYWPGLSKENKVEFTNLFKKRLKSSYLEKLSLYNNQKIVYKTPVQDRRKMRIPTEVISKDKKISMLYKLYKSKHNWKIYDIEIEGISIIVTYRSQFDQILSKGTIDDLLLQLGKPEKK